MRGIPSSVTSIRKKVFTEVARMAYDGAYDRMEALPYAIVPGDTSTPFSARASPRAPSRRNTMIRR